MKCDECGAKFASNKEAGQHFHATQTLSHGTPIIVLIALPDGCTSGRWEAAEEFTTAISALREKYPSKKFQFVPFDHSEGALTALLAIEQ